MVSWRIWDSPRCSSDGGWCCASSMVTPPFHIVPLRLSLSEAIICESVNRREGSVWYLHAYRPATPIFS